MRRNASRPVTTRWRLRSALAILCATAAGSLIAGCTTVRGEGALAGGCEVLDGLAGAHAGALAALPTAPASDAAITSGRALIEAVDVTCGRR